ncbi:hypothetical protein A1F94_002331 [Pyrenophora tritici-repentis]|uniref:Uncharacterized protein n=1 Tax=Pyrenophora tritici-repentis TaxID=45151 RepID=A0A921PF09_9PLEO|nr:hypothetical protein A1F99_029870 [Pyrenophora tritici-repentis]KAG9385581.1 hypothetical protein A1F94_002331 [Pyrenophora tritici-repentis]KAI0592173.1 hypothetical protein Alg130_00460 [Pyrenophora tritici-repentis]KAI0615293.1 hypothetical protein TUN205_00381 [Pyrenophora tritici-repentis]KAI0622180.1 hypothetical protein TUN199_05839 [Pyrenophora tritici-repentis]
MPRPPRTKVASRVAKPPARKQQAKPTPAQTKKASETANSFSDDSDGLVKKSRQTGPRRRMPWEETPEVHEEAELTMTGALPVNEEAQAQPTETRTPASSASKRARSTRGSARSSAKKASPNEIAPPQQDVEAEEDSGFGDLTFSSLGSNSPAHGTRPPSAIKVGATPAHERSVLALTNFKRRARQPSLLRMVQQTDVEDNDDDTLDNTDNFDFDDFLPHAESTPLNVRKNRTEEETRNDSGTHVSSSASRGTKRKLSPAVVQVPRSSPPGSPLSERDIEVERSPSPSLPEVLPSQEQIIGQTQEDEEPMSETLAPPMSSSTIGEESEPPSPAQTRPRRRGRQSKTPVRYNESEAEETETPAKAKRGAKKKAEQKISTAQLKDLLPRRRNRYRDRDEFDVVSSDDIEQVDSDEDELQMPERRVRQRQAAGKLASPKATKKPTRGKKAASKAAQKASKTYSRRISSDKENDKAGQGDAETTEVSAIEHSEKLEAIRKKFAEVDAFELEFEDVTATTSSSPFR